MTRAEVDQHILARIQSAWDNRPIDGDARHLFQHAFAEGARCGMEALRLFEDMDESNVQV